MIELPDFSKAFDYENNFYLSCNITRISKILAHYELYKSVINVPGAIIECGVFKGVSFTRFSTFREIFENQYSKKLIGFDIFGTFPETTFSKDKAFRNEFIENAGDQSISEDQLMHILKNKGIDKNVELIKGDITKTVPKYVEEHPELKISLLNLDVDIYEPSVTVLEYLYPKITQGGVLILDDYGKYPGETKAVDDYFENKKVNIRKYPFCTTPCYIVKN